MTSESKLESALQKIGEIVELLKCNEYEQFFSSHLIPVQFELQRQLTNIQFSAKIKK